MGFANILVKTLNNAGVTQTQTDADKVLRPAATRHVLLTLMLR